MSVTLPERDAPSDPDDMMRPSRAVSPLLLRILAVNVMALAILVGGILYLGNYQERIIATELDAMLSQARIVASAVAENAVVIDNNDQSILSPLLARMMVRRLAETTGSRMRLFSASETLLADSRYLLAGRGGKIEVEDLPTSGDEPVSWGARAIAAVFDVIDIIHEHRAYPPYGEQVLQRASHYNVTTRALHGEKSTQVWSLPHGGLILAVAEPVAHGRRVLGAVMMSRTDASVDKAIYAVRINILQIFFITLGITILLSLYLARAIARPIRQLAQAAEVLRRGQTSQTGISGIANLLHEDAIPDMTARRDEIGDLSGALRDLTAALARRVGDIENFAADVAHEIKNPLTSLRSAVETVERVQEPAAQKKLMLIIRDDVDRMTRLITDISSASRLDAELGRAEWEPIDIGVKLARLEDYYRSNSALEGQPPRVVLAHPVVRGLRVRGVKGRLVQVFQNLLDNALSFSPPDEPVRLSIARVGARIQITVEDSGPGIPENKREAIFDRFYSERPKSEKFGTHSGLGLSISKQIIEAHRGRIWAENRKDAAGNVIGAKFVVQLPMMGEN
ncbi:MAG: stimulus-sensing domain-containing protein [Alphaproteobacteria bacterium]|nr:stimulus-sensing domain-containing protein [Alphaproteobacteria bacterium]